ncbi:MAG: metallophosphoesterase family protein [Candidatus Hermodarchaeota archaeon]
MVEIIVISDTHMGKDFSVVPSSFLNIARSADLLVHCGDFVTREAYDFFSNLNQLEAVVGNMDSGSLRSFLPEIKTFDIEDKKIGLIHGWGAPWDLDKNVYKRFKSCDIIFFGHSHARHNAMIAETFMVNPGAFKGRKGVQYGLVRIKETKIEVELFIVS